MYSIISIIFFIALISASELQERQFTTCNPSVASSATTISLDGTSYSGLVNGTNPCIFYIFTVPASLNADVELTISSNNILLDAYLVNSMNTDLNTYDFTLATSTYANFFYYSAATRIPGFALAGKTWYLRFFIGFSDQSATFSFNATQVTPATTPTIINGKTTVTTTLQEYGFPIWQVTIPDSTRSYTVTLSNLKSSVSSNSFTLYIALNRCPTNTDSSTYSGYSTPLSIYTAAPGDKVYILGSTYNTNTSVSFDVDVEPVVCGPATGLQICAPYVTYNTPAVTTSASQSEGLLSIFIVFGGCDARAVAVICGGIFPKCDANGFPIPPCPSDCTTLLNECPGFKTTNGSSSCSTVAPGVTTYCYAAGSGSTISVSFAIIIAILSLIWM